MDDTLTAKNRPGFIRIVVVNTYMIFNRIEEIPLDRPTALLGKNQIGKTSILKLLSFFFGETPARIQPVVADRQNFLSFFLPTTSSYIACEYYNANGQVRSVVVHPDPARTAIQYRLIRGPLRKELFVTLSEGGSFEFIPCADFERNANQLGVDVNSRLVTSTRDYRGIIQGHYPPESTLARSGFNGLIEDYGIGRRSAPLYNIEKLALTALQNNFAVTDLLLVITRKVTDHQENRISIFGGASGLERLSIAKDFRAYKTVMRLEPKFREAEREGHRHTEYTDEIKELKTRLADGISHTVTRLKALDEKQTSMNRSHKDSLKQTGEQIDAVISASAEHVARSEALAALIEDIDKTEAKLRSLAADRAAQALAERPSLEARLETVSQSITMITGDRQATDRQFEEILARIKNEERADLDANSELALALREKRSSVYQHQGVKKQEARNDLEARHARQLADIEKRAETQRARHRDTLDALYNVTADSVTIENREVQADRVKSKQLEQDRIEQLSIDSQDLLKSEDDTLHQASAKLSDLRSKLSGVEARHAKVQERREPDPASLQAWLERSKPEWRDTIGKIIDERLLERTNLSPDNSLSSEGVFGLHIDLQNVESGCPSIEALEHQQITLTEEIAALSLAIKEAEKQEKTIAGSRNRASREHDKNTAQLEIAKTGLENAIVGLAAAEKEEAISLEEARAKAQAKRKDIEAKIEEINEKRTALQVNHTAMVQEVEKGIDETAQSEISALDAEIETLGQKRTEISRIAIERAEKLKSEHDAALIGKGQDADTLGRLVKEEEDLTEKLQALLPMERLERDWTDFVGTLTPRRQGYRDEIQTLELQVASCNEKLRNLKSDRRDAVESFEGAAEALKNEYKILNELKLRAEMRLQVKGEEIIPSEDAPINPMSIISVIEELDQAEARRKEAANQVYRLVRQLKHGFRSTSGQIREIVETNVDIEGDLLWLPIFAMWYDSGHTAMWVSIRSAVTMTTQPILESYRKLQEADDAIATMSRRLRASIAALPAFPGVSDVDISVRSRLRQQQFWGRMEALVGEYRAWREDPENIDVDGLIETLEAYLDCWPTGATPEVNLAEMIYIEGSLREGDHLVKINRNTKIGEISSGGGSSIIRLILLTAAVNLIRDKSDVRFTWCLDELAHVDEGNIRLIIKMSEQNNITLIAGAPDLGPGALKLFTNVIRMEGAPGRQGSSMSRIDLSGESGHGIREWDSCGNLRYPRSVS